MICFLSPSFRLYFPSNPDWNKNTCTHCVVPASAHHDTILRNLHLFPPFLSAGHAGIIFRVSKKGLICPHNRYIRFSRKTCFFVVKNRDNRSKRRKLGMAGCAEKKCCQKNPAGLYRRESSPMIYSPLLNIFPSESCRDFSRRSPISRSLYRKPRYRPARYQYHSQALPSALRSSLPP